LDDVEGLVPDACPFCGGDWGSSFASAQRGWNLSLCTGCKAQKLTPSGEGGTAEVRRARPGAASDGHPPPIQVEDEARVTSRFTRDAEPSDSGETIDGCRS
jgi:hypothetical protein